MSVYCPETMPEYLRRTQCVPDYIPDEQIRRYIREVQRKRVEQVEEFLEEAQK